MPTAFVTGAAMGQGLLLAQKLSKRGWRVYAGILPGIDRTDLASDPKIVVVEQDVSNTESVRQSAAVVKAALGDQPLDLLLNVAGIANIAQGVVEGLSLEEMERLFSINAFGQVRVVQSFLPFLRKASPPARIINFSSGAILVNPPGAGAYNMTKHAIHGLTMVLRNELAAFGMQATSILPGGVKTAMTANAHETTKAMWDKIPPSVRAAYEPVLGNTTMKVLPDMLEKHGNSPDYVTDEVLKLLAVKRWKPFYCVGRDVRPMGVMRSLLSDMAFESIIRRTFKIPRAPK